MKSYESLYNIILELKSLPSESWEDRNKISLDRLTDTYSFQLSPNAVYPLKVHSAIVS